MRTFLTIMLFALTSAHWSMSQPVLSTDALPTFQVEGRVRNGNTGFEGVLFTPSTPGPGQPGGGQWQMNPVGNPIWNSNGNIYGDTHSFQLIYLRETGSTVWNVDFNRDGDYADAQESVSQIDTSLAGKGFRYVNVWGQGNATGLTASLTNLTINGSNMGNFSSNSTTPFTPLFKETAGYFSNITITGNFSFSGNGGQESPRIWVRLGTAIANDTPSVSLTSPVSGNFNAGDLIGLAANAQDSDGSVTRVEFYIDNVLVGVDSIAPYTDNYTCTVGTHTIWAVAYDNNGQVGRSPVVTIVVAANNNTVRVPTLSQWYLIVFALLLAIAGAVVMNKDRISKIFGGRSAT